MDRRATAFTLFPLLHPQAELEALIERLTAPEWEDLLQVARELDLAPLLYYRLCQANVQHRLPASIHASLRQLSSAAAADTMRQLGFAGHILSTLRARGIEVIVLKGLYLTEEIYPAVGLRSFDDFDLLLQPADLPEALSSLQELGYTLFTWYDPKTPDRDVAHIPPLQQPGFPTVELHHTILGEQEPFSIDPAGLWQRAVRARVAEVDVSALCPEDLLLHLCLHLAYQHRLARGVRGLYDLATVLQRRGAEIDEARLVETARQWGAERVTWLSLRLMQRVTGVEAPGEVLRSLQPEAVPAEVEEQALRQLIPQQRGGIRLTPDLAALARARGWRERLRLVAQRVFLPRQRLAREYNVNPRSLKIYCYYPRRALDLYREYHLTAWNVLRGRREEQQATRWEEESARLHQWLAGGGR